MKNLQLIGRITADAKDIKRFENQTGKYAFITIAVSNGKDKDGEDRPSDFFDVLIRENVLKYLDAVKNIKGALVYTENNISVKTVKKGEGNSAVYEKEVFISNRTLKVLFTVQEKPKTEPATKSATGDFINNNGGN